MNEEQRKALFEYPPSKPYCWFKKEDGSCTAANSAIIGLMYWHGAQLPQEEIDNPQPLVVYRGRSIPSEDDPMLPALAVAACERKWGKGPVLVPNDREHQAEQILCWLLTNGDIVELWVDREKVEG